MTPDWQEWEGDIAGEFPLEKFLGAGETSAVFRTRRGTAPAAIKLAIAPDPKARIDQWNRAAAVLHPRLIRIYKTGTWNKDGATVVFVVMELAEENLGAVLAERALTAEETGEMLAPVAETLVFLHGRGLAHGALRAANLLAVNDSLKLSSDSIAPGEAAGDLRDLGSLLRRAMWEELPAPFAAIARDCSGAAPCSANDVLQRLRPETAKAPRAGRKAKPTRYAIAFGILLAIVVTAGSLWRSRQEKSPPVVAAAIPQATPQPAPEPAPTPAPEKVAEKRTPVRESRHVAPSADEVIARAMPEIPAPALRTVRGTATVVVRVAINDAGEVTAAAPERGSRYFGKFAAEAARKWRFARGASRDRLLRFEITRNDTQAFVEQVR